MWYYEDNPATLEIEEGSINGGVAMTAIMCVLYGAFQAAGAQNMGPDVSKAKQATLDIFKVIETPSEINALADEKSKDSIEEKRNSETNNSATGMIEFVDVWFRYPSRPD